MPVVHPLLVPATQTRQPFAQLLRVPHLQMLGVQPDLDLRADQPARHRVAIPLDMDQTARIDPATHLPERLLPSRRQRPQQRSLFLQPLPPPRVELTKQLPQELVVLLPAGEIAAAAQHQRLVHGVLEAVVPLLDVAVLVGVARLDLLGHQPIMLHQAFVALREVLLLRRVVHRQAHPVGPVSLWHATQLPQRVLQPLAQTLEALREADRPRLPVRVGQHEVVDHVVERLPRDRHSQAAHPREVRRRQPARLMHLGEEHLLRRPVLRPPTPHLPLQRPHLPIREPAGVAALQLAHDRLGPQSRLVHQHRPHLLPDIGERVRPRHPVVRLGHLAG